MRKAPLTLAPLLLTVACGGPAGPDVSGSGVAEGAIINGEICNAQENDTAVAILVDATVSFGGFGEQEMKTVVCTGTLIAPDVVLTAAHCIDASAATGGFGEVVSENYFVTRQADLLECLAIGGISTATRRCDE